MRSTNNKWRHEKTWANIERSTGLDKQLGQWRVFVRRPTLNRKVKM